jgi:hypothetical protein
MCMLVYTFVLTKEHTFVFVCTLVFLRLCISFSEFCILNALGSCIIF